MKLDLNYDSSRPTLQKYKDYRNYLGKLIEKTKSKYYNEQLQIANNNKETWRLIQEITNENRQSVITIQEIIDENKQTQSKDADIANVFNNYFADVCKMLANQIPQIEKPYVLIQRHTLFLTPTDTNEVINLIGELKNKSISGPDGI